MLLCYDLPPELKKSVSSKKVQHLRPCYVRPTMLW